MVALSALYIAKQRGLDPSKVEVRDDGQGPYIARWPDDSPPTAEQLNEVAGVVEADRVARLQISELERTVTPRRMREALLSEEGRLWLDAVEEEIEGLRGDLLS